MTSHCGTRNPRLVIGIIAVAHVFVALTPRGAASQPAEEASSPRGRDYVLSRLWDWLQNGGDNEEATEDGVVDEQHEQQPTYPVLERTLRSPSPVRRNSGMHNIFRLDKRSASGGNGGGGGGGWGDGAYRLDRRDGAGMHGIFRLDKRASTAAAAAGGRSARSGSHMHNVFRLDRRSVGAGGASNMHHIFRLDRR